MDGDVKDGISSLVEQKSSRCGCGQAQFPEKRDSYGSYKDASWFQLNQCP